jgi:hypothetical protein
MSAETSRRLAEYKTSLEMGSATCGQLLFQNLQISKSQISHMSNDEFLELLIQTKKPQIFAEAHVFGDGRDWNEQELRILGDLNFAVPVTIYDDGVHQNGQNVKIKNHKHPFSGELLFIPGALLRNDKGIATPDMKEVIKNGQIDYQSLYKLYERRLLPSLIYANNSAGQNGALITMPGIGCGAFAGVFKEQLEQLVQNILQQILINHSSKLQNIKGLIFDPNDPKFSHLDGLNAGTCLITKTGKFGAENSQLKPPAEYGSQFKNCKFFSIVAWDHVSWPGNDFYNGKRSTDDGVKAAATSLCESMTGITGQYDTTTHKFNPPTPFKDWQGVISQYGLKLTTQGRVSILNENGVFIALQQPTIAPTPIWQHPISSSSSSTYLNHAAPGIPSYNQFLNPAPLTASTWQQQFTPQPLWIPTPSSSSSFPSISSSSSYTVPTTTSYNLFLNQASTPSSTWKEQFTPQKIKFERAYYPDSGSYIFTLTFNSPYERTDFLQTVGVGITPANTYSISTSSKPCPLIDSKDETKLYFTAFKNPQHPEYTSIVFSDISQLKKFENYFGLTEGKNLASSNNNLYFNDIAFDLNNLGARFSLPKQRVIQ